MLLLVRITMCWNELFIRNLSSIFLHRRDYHSAAPSDKSAKSKSEDKKCGKYQTGSKKKHHSKNSLSEFDVTSGKFQKNRNEKNTGNQARSTVVSSR